MINYEELFHSQQHSFRPLTLLNTSLHTHNTFLRSISMYLLYHSPCMLKSPPRCLLKVFSHLKYILSELSPMSQHYGLIPLMLLHCTSNLTPRNVSPGCKMKLSNFHEISRTLDKDATYGSKVASCWRYLFRNASHL